MPGRGLTSVTGTGKDRMAAMSHDSADLTALAERQRRVAIAIEGLRAGDHRPLSLDELAELASYSRYHFVRTFRETTGTSPGAFQTALRFHRARELLLTTTASITEICGEVGYRSLGTFSDRFRELVGVSPSALRELPDRIADVPPSTLAALGERPAPGGCRFRVMVPEVAAQRFTYVGLFPDGQASGPPVAGTMIHGAGTATLGGFPTGRYYLLAAAFPAPIEGLGHLLPGEDLLVGASGRAIAIGTAGRPVWELRLRPLARTDAPILTALPALLLARLT